MGRTVLYYVLALIFLYWLANESPPWAAYRAFMSGRLIVLEKQPGVSPVGVGETWLRLFANIILKFTVLEETMACKDNQLCSGLKAGIDGVIHGVQALWDKNRLRRNILFNS